jgi:hypothetical protein
LILHAREAEQATTTCAGIIRPALQGVKERAKRLFGPRIRFWHPVPNQPGSVDARIEIELSQCSKKKIDKGREVSHLDRLSC